MIAVKSQKCDAQLLAGVRTGLKNRRENPGFDSGDDRRHHENA
jgi:hypothetical protein